MEQLFIIILLDAKSACANDIAINSTNLEEAHILLNIAYDYSCKEHYKLQPQQSVVKKRGKSTPIQLQLNGTNLPSVEKTAHLGIQRSKTDKDTIENTVNENIILDCSFLLNNDIIMKLGYRKLSVNKLTDLEFQCRRHIYIICTVPDIE